MNMSWGTSTEKSTPKVIFGLKKNELVSELLASVFDAHVGVGSDQHELASQRFVGEQADASVVKLGHDVARVGAEKEGLV